MQRLQEMILDEEKIVTVNLIADELKVSHLEAQNLVKSFLEDNRNLQVVYLLSGVLLASKNFSVELVRGEDLKTKKKQYEIISNEIIYSIQKTTDVDFNLIAVADSGYFNRTPFLKTKNAVKRNINRKAPVESPSTVTKSKVSAFASFKSTDSSNSDSKTETKENGRIQSSQKKEGKQGGITNFFAKANTKSQSDLMMEPEVVIEEKSIKNDEEKMDVEIEEVKSPKVEEPKPKKTPKKADDSNKKKRKKDNKNQGPNKKRKRIQQICDSDSDDMFGDENNVDIIEMSDEEPPSNPPVQSIKVPPKKKVRKTVDKTYQDEEGFLVTKTEYVYESEPEEEAAEPPKAKLDEKPPPEKKTEKNNANPKPPTGKGKNNKKQANGKQPTLMSFFKKA